MPWSKGFLVVTLILAITALPSKGAPQDFVMTGEEWTYWDWGFEPEPDLDVEWESPFYDDFGWSFGASPLGFGEPGMATTVQDGIMTAYFRHYFFVDVLPNAPVMLRVKRDDGVVVYLNGWEVFRNNMPEGFVEYGTAALADVEAASYLEAMVDPGFFVPGYNLIAAEVHQRQVVSPDLVFDLQLQQTGGGSGGPVTLIRGPYLQIGTPTSIVVKWRTSPASDSLVRYGRTPGNLNQSAQVTVITTEHEVPLTGLLPNTKYYYSIGSSSFTNASGNDYFFVTSPAGPKPTRVWVIGDSGGAAVGAGGPALVRDAYYGYSFSRYTDVWLMLGDNAYQSGTDSEYQRGMFDIYGNILRQTVVWPTIGNHDASPAYFDIFTLPTSGEAGGVASGVENYYSFDYGDIHFICLGGYFSGSRLSNGVMCTWLKADLEANTNKWLIAYWHQPPYTKGSHNSDTEGDLREMRENAVPILESYGVDLVLCGHSHVYERSYLLRGHYGHSSTLESSMILDSRSGRPDDTGPYVKQTSGPNAQQGTVYVVAGSSGWTLGCCYGHHPAMYIDHAEIGSLVLDIDGDTLHGRFLRETGYFEDHFTIVKDSTLVQIVSVTLEDGTATLTWTSTAGRSYRVEFTGDLAAAWTPLGDPVQAVAPLTSIAHVTGGALQGFYRVSQID
jgi:acid phosphatase type 7